MGTLNKGVMMIDKNHVTLKNIAEAAGVSISTVSHVINNTRFVKKETREKVENVMESLSFSMGKGHSKKMKYLGLIVADITEDYSISVIKSIENRCEEVGLSIIVCDSQDNLDIEHQNINKLLDNDRIVGIIISPVNSEECNPRLVKTKLPVVCIDRKLVKAKKIFFGINNLQSGSFATEYLHDNGCTSIGFIGYPVEIYSVNQREMGYELAWRKCNRANEPHVLRIAYFQKDAVEKITQFIKKNRLDGLICATSGVCRLVVEAIEEMDLSIPENIKIVSYDENKWFNYLKYPISVITQPVKDIAEASVNMILKLTDGINCPKDETSEVLLQTGFIDRLNKKEE
jgi:DNA-binding LacI/PurR family transcriptional regulator